MFSWRYTVFFTALCLLFFIFAVQRAALDKQAKQIEQAQQQNRLYQQENQRLQQTLKTTQQLAEQKQQQLSQMFEKTEQLNQQIQQRDTQLNELYHERTTRDWATTDLPPLIKQLRNRPACTSAGDYRKHLHNTDPVPVTSDQSTNQ